MAFGSQSPSKDGIGKKKRFLWKGLLVLAATACILVFLVNTPKSRLVNQIQSQSAPSCVGRWNRILDTRDRNTKWSTLEDISPNAVFVSGQSAMKRWSLADNQMTQFVDAFFWDEKHKFFDVEKKRFMVYPDNTVITADVGTCHIDAIYQPTASGDLNPRIQRAVGLNKEVATDKGGCNKGILVMCEYDGVECRTKTPNVNQRCCCPSGWRYSKRIECCGNCGDWLTCGEFGNRGTHCTLRTNPCTAVSGLSTKLSGGADVVGKIQASADITTSILKMNPKTKALGYAVSVISSFMGLTGTSSPSEIYKNMMKALEAMQTRIMDCMHLQLADTDERDIKTWMLSIQNELRPDVLSSAAGPAARVRIFRGNEQRCVQIGARFTLIKSKPHYYDVMPLALRAAELCVANFLGLVADLAVMKNSGKSLSAKRLEIILDNTIDSLEHSILTMETYHLHIDRCGFWKSDKDLVHNKISMLRSSVVHPIRQMRVKLNPRLPEPTTGCIDFVGYNIIGNDEKHAPRTDAAACGSWCRNYVGCVGFTFDEGMKQCFLKKGVSSGFEVRMNNVKSGVCLNGVTCPSSGRWDNKNLKDHDIANAGDLPAFSFEQCKLMCLVHSGCKFFTRNKNTNRCYLKSGDGGLQDTNNDESGRCK